MGLTISNTLSPAKYIYIHFLKNLKKLQLLLILQFKIKASGRPVTATKITTCLDAANQHGLYRAPNKPKPIEDSSDFQPAPKGMIPAPKNTGCTCVTVKKER